MLASFFARGPHKVYATRASRLSTQALVLRIIRILHSLHTTEFWTRKGFTFVWTFVEKISTRSEIHLIYDSPVLTTPFLLRLRSYRRFSRMYNTRVRFACPIYFSRDQSSSKLIIFLDSKLERSNSRVAKIDSRLDSRNFRGSRMESWVEFRNSWVTVNLRLSGTVPVPAPSSSLRTLRNYSTQSR